MTQVDGLHKKKKGSKYADDVTIEFHFLRATQAVRSRHVLLVYWYGYVGVVDLYAWFVLTLTRPTLTRYTQEDDLLVPSSVKALMDIVSK